MTRFAVIIPTLNEAGGLREALVQAQAAFGADAEYIVSDGGPAPFRFHIRSPSYINLSPLKFMSVGATVADAIVILGSVDIVVGEVDR